MTELAPFDVLELRAWARARLWAWAGEIDSIPEAVDPLQAFAEESDLVDLFTGEGQDAVQQIIAAAFEPVRDDLVVADHEVPSDSGASPCDICACAPCQTPGFCPLCREADAEQARPPAPRPEKRPMPQSTIEAIKWTIRERGPAALSEPGNVERLQRCDADALAEIDRRMENPEMVRAS